MIVRTFDECRVAPRPLCKRQPRLRRANEPAEWMKRLAETG
jgi:hypothetical protein